MVRRIIHIDEEKCNGCGACANACHESAIGMVNGKAKLLRDDYCDGLGDCLPACPTNAITFVEREAAAYDEAAVLANKAKKDAENAKSAGTSAPAHAPMAGGCPGTRMRMLNQRLEETGESAPAAPQQSVSRLGQWPVPDQAGCSECTVFQWCKITDRSRLYRLCICPHA